MLIIVKNKRLGFTIILSWILILALKDLLQVQSDRYIVYIIGAKGNEGKSFYIKNKILHAPKVFGLVSTMFTSAQMMTALASIGERAYYFADVPRATREMYYMYQVLESLKNGLLSVFMYGKYDVLAFEKSPGVVVFSNDYPNLEYASLDRWKLYTIEYNSDGSSFLKESPLKFSGSVTKFSSASKKSNKSMVSK